jgi:hypothetical protein
VPPAHKLFYIEHGGSRHWLQWQFGLPGLAEILIVLTAKAAQGFSVADFFCAKLTFSTSLRTIRVERT